MQRTSFLIAGTVVSKHHHNQHHWPKSYQYSHSWWKEREIESVSEVSCIFWGEVKFAKCALTHDKCTWVEGLYLEDASGAFAEPQPQAKTQEGKPQHLQKHRNKRKPQNTNISGYIVSHNAQGQLKINWYSNCVGLNRWCVGEQNLFYMQCTLL